MDALEDGERELWHAWKRAAESVRERVAAEISQATGLSDADFAVLSRVADAGGTLRQNELAAAIGWHRSRLSHQLSRMRDRGLLTSTAVADGVQVTLTEAGTAGFVQARPVHARAVRAHLTDRVPPADRAALVELLVRLNQGGTADPSGQGASTASADGTAVSSSGSADWRSPSA